MKPVFVCWAVLTIGVTEASASTYYEQGDAGQLVPTAAVVPVGTTKIVGSLGPTFEADLYRLTFTKPLHVSFQVITTGNWFDDDMTLFDAVGHPIAVSDYAFSIDLAAGTYHFGLTDWDAAATDATGRIIADDYSHVLDTTAILGGWVQTGWPWRYGSYEINIVPEPITLSLIALGGLLVARRRQCGRCMR